MQLAEKNLPDQKSKILNIENFGYSRFKLLQICRQFQFSKAKFLRFISFKLNSF